MAGPMILASLTAFLGVVSANGIYTKSSPVIQVDARNYDSLIAKSNHTSIVEFYAPWCGHCQNLKPAYEKAAKNLAGLAKVAAVNCDEESNKPFCGSMGVQGFPTLKIVRPGAKPGKPVVEDYQGQRTAKGIVDAVVEKIPNHVKRLSDKGLDEWLAQGNETAKALLFTEKGTTSALLRAVAVDFLGSITVAQIRNKEETAVETFGIMSFPTLVLLPGGDQDSLVYDGEMKKAPIVEFLSQVAAPNPDPAPKAAKSSSSKKPKSSKSASSAFSKASASYKSAEASQAAASATDMTVEEALPTESPDPKVETEDPVVELFEVPVIPPLTELSSADLAQQCLGEKTGTCVLALSPSSDAEASISERAAMATSSLAELAEKHRKRNAHLFPIYSVPGSNEGAATLRKSLGLQQPGCQVIAINGKRGWWRLYDSAEYSTTEMEKWIDAIRMGEGEKQKLPDGVLLSEKPQMKAEHDEL